jgi:hypothetical protein
MIQRAILTATIAHEGLVRKGTDRPYIIHPVSVGTILAMFKAPEWVISAGFLHDVVEDTAVRLEFIRKHFGDDVARIVEGCTEEKVKGTWEERKAAKLDSLEWASPEIRLVVCADKFDNARWMLKDYQKVGDKLWTRFNRGRDAQEKNYRDVLRVLEHNPFPSYGFPVRRELKTVINYLFGNGEPQKVVQFPKRIVAYNASEPEPAMLDGELPLWSPEKRAENERIRRSEELEKKIADLIEWGRVQPRREMIKSTG